jgi:hypothetical protein
LAEAINCVTGREKIINKYVTEETVRKFARIINSLPT